MSDGRTPATNIPKPALVCCGVAMQRVFLARNDEDHAMFADRDRECRSRSALIMVAPARTGCGREGHHDR